MSFLKAPLLLTNAYLSYRAWTPPVSHKLYKDEMVKEDEKAVKPIHGFIAASLNVLYTALCLTEALVILALQYPNEEASQSILDALLPPSLPHNRTPHLQNLTAPFLLGSFLLISGCLIRLHCFHELGKLFTFDFCIRKDHELITTGLYAYVRHPSYTGVLLHYVGTLFCHITRNSWLRESGFLWRSKLVAALTVFYLFIMTARMVYAFQRAREEDEGLKKEFGEKWEEYSRRVRYRVIPGVL